MLNSITQCIGLIVINHQIPIYVQEPCSQCLKYVQKSLIFTLRAMRATVTFKNAQNGQFSELLKIEATSVNSVTRPVCFNKTKIGRKCQSGQKFIKNAKNSLYWRVEACSQTVLPDW